MFFLRLGRLGLLFWLLVRCSFCCFGFVGGGDGCVWSVRCAVYVCKRVGMRRLTGCRDVCVCIL